MKLRTIPEFPSGRLIETILENAVNSVDPHKLVDFTIVTSINGNFIGKKRISRDENIVLVAMGKASIAMSQAAVDRLGGQIRKGVCVCKSLPEELPHWQNIELIQGAHPVPDERSLEAGQKVREVLAKLQDGERVLALISGGSSALVVDPCESISLEDIQTMNKVLLKCGATIDEMNCLRKHVERLKGGGMARLAFPAAVDALLLSDVIGNDMSVIASGPTVPDPTTYQDALTIVKKYRLEHELPRSILVHLQNGAKGLTAETLKADDPVNGNIQNLIIGSNRHAIDSAVKNAEGVGFDCCCLSDHMVGEAELASEWFLRQAISAADGKKKPFMAIAGGETTVMVRGSGKGGRNLQVALAAIEEMAKTKNAVLVTLATDGEDGPTDAAGAFVTTETKTRAQALGLDPGRYLANNDAYTFFERVGGLIKTGSTGTNVNDLTFFFQF